MGVYPSTFKKKNTIKNKAGTKRTSILPYKYSAALIRYICKMVNLHDNGAI